jgi:hypothetical protein
LDWKEDLFGWVKEIQVRQGVREHGRDWGVGWRKRATNTILMINIKERGKKWKRVAES